MQCFEKTFLYINLSKIKPIVFFYSCTKRKAGKGSLYLLFKFTNYLNQFFLDYFIYLFTTGSTILLRLLVPWWIELVAMTPVLSSKLFPPVLRFRSNLGKLELLTSMRI